MPSIEEFGKKLKEKYPQYNAIDDRELGLKMLEKHPEYKDRVFDTDPNTQAQIAGTETKGVFDAVKKGFSNIKEGIQRSGQELQATLQSDAPKPIKFAKTATGLVKGMISPLAEAAVATPARVLGEAAQNVTGIDVNEAVAQGTQRLVQKGLDTEQAKKAMEGWSQLKETNPDAAMALSTVLDIADIASNVVGIKGATVAGEVGLKGAMKTAKVAGETAGKAVKATGEAGKYAVGQTFGLNKETVKNIIDNPKLFTPKEIEKIDRESIFTKAKNALEARMEALSETGKEYNKIREIPVKTSVSENTILEKLAEKGIDVKDGKITVNLGSEIQLSKADISGLEEVLGLLKGKDGLTPTEILNLRKRLSNLSGFAEGRTDASSKVAKEIRATIDQIAKKEIPGLAEVDARFSSERQFLDKVKGVMFDKKGNIKDNAISKIATLTGKGKEMMLERMEKVIPGITEDLNILKAIEDIDYAKSQKVGTYGRTLLGAGGGMAVGGPVGAILGAIATSPQVGVTLLRSYGRAKGLAKDAIEAVVNKMKAGKKLLDTEKKLIDEAVNSAAEKAGSRLKDMGGKGGLSIKNVSTPAQKRAATLARKQSAKEKAQVADAEKMVAEGPNAKYEAGKKRAFELAKSAKSFEDFVKRFKNPNVKVLKQIFLDAKNER